MDDSTGPTGHSWPTGQRWLTRHRWLTAEVGLLALTTGALAVGAALGVGGSPGAARAVWTASTAVGVGAAGRWLVDSVRQGHLGVDLIAVLALVGAVLVGEPLAGAVIAVMLASGRLLEARAGARAARELGRLLERAPRHAQRYGPDGSIERCDIDDVRPGDVLLVAPGAVLPVDGIVARGPAVLDESALTGEPLPVQHETADVVRSGTVNGGQPFDLRASAPAAESTYAGIVRLVAEAHAQRAPFVRLADRVAVAFVPFTIVVAAGAWALSGDATRAVAVLVVATPCPLILAAPIAIVSGIARAARRGVVIKGGAVLEQLARAEVLLFDKTGTLTSGRPTVAEVVTEDGASATEVLRLAASIDQVSPHVLATALVRAGHQRNLALTPPTDTEEIAGRGIRGMVEGHLVAVGTVAWLLEGPLPRWARAARRRAELDGALTVAVAIDGRPVGIIVLDDPIRPDAARTLRALRRDGIERLVMVTGDRADVAETVGAVLGVDAVLAERTPAEKVEAVRQEGRTRRTIMVGDGINDAPALAVADVGVALGARGSTASSEAADVILTVDRLARLGEAIEIARRAHAIARQSVVVGIGLSLAAMAVAASGHLPPAWGALLQEVIDVAVILNALRVLRLPGREVQVDEAEGRLVERFAGEHRTLHPDVARLRRAADSIGVAAPAVALAEVRSVHRFLLDDLLPHEEAEDAELYPVFARVLGGTDPTGTMSRAHTEIAHHIRRIGRLLQETDPGDPDPEDLADLRRILYGLHAILELHFAQEDEGYLSLVDDVAP